jgi:hypothetical protein
MQGDVLAPLPVDLDLGRKMGGEALAVAGRSDAYDLGLFAGGEELALRRGGPLEVLRFAAESIDS